MRAPIPTPNPSEEGMKKAAPTDGFKNASTLPFLRVN